MKCTCHSHNGFVLGGPALAGAPAQQISFEGLTPTGAPGRVDRSVSVSALVEPVEPVFVDALIDQQYRRFLNGF